MIAVFDIGNTNITIGIFEDKLIQKYTLATNKENSIRDWEAEITGILGNKKIEGCIISSVVDEVTENFIKACDNVFGENSINLTAKMDLGIGIKTEQPESIGADRLANVFGALKYPLPAIVVDAGTAITFDVVDKDKNFIGGIILPGIDTQLESLYEKTSKLPIIKAREISNAIGYDTETCILSGVICGAACAIDGLLERCERELGSKATVIGTGGQIEMVSKYMKRKIDYIDKDHTLEALFTIYCKERKINGNRF